MIKVRDIIVFKQGKVIDSRIIGLKHIFFSNELLKECDYEYMATNSFLVPIKVQDKKFVKKGRSKSD